ncbi:MAG TPA: hypothetical protein PKJ85_12985, partial [Nitrosomonas nitrosa]|nr:hypothetical protein [Nitrosomonas nitrosa]
VKTYNYSINAFASRGKIRLIALGTNVVPRLRFGVRETGQTGKAGEHVQTRFSGEAQLQLSGLIDEAIEVISQRLPL